MDINLVDAHSLIDILGGSLQKTPVGTAQLCNLSYLLETLELEEWLGIQPQTPPPFSELQQN